MRGGLFVVPGRTVQFLIFAIFVVWYYISMERFKKTGRVYIREFVALDTMAEAVGRATELGKPTFFTFGTGALDAQHFAAFNILGYLAKLCAKYDTRVIVALQLPETFPMVEEIVKSAFLAEGKADKYRPDDIRFFGDSHNPAMIGIIAREQPAGNFMIGNLFHESVLGLEAGARVGAIQVTGSMNTHQLPFMAAGSDAMFIGSEMFAASAQISRSPIQVGSVLAEELIKYAGVVLMIIGCLATVIGDKTLPTLLLK
jgi:hypothetical protein